MNPDDINFWLMISTAIMAGGTFVMIAVNIFLNYKDREINKKNLNEMKEANKESKKSLQEMKKATIEAKNSTEEMANSTEEMRLTREESNRAYILLYFKQKGHRIHLIIKNFGLTEAKNVKIKSDESIKTIIRDINGENVEKIIFENNFIKFFPPGFEIVSFFDMTHNYIENMVGEGNYPIYPISIEYKDIYGELHEMSYELDLKHLQIVGFLEDEENDIETSLSKIAENTAQN